MLSTSGFADEVMFASGIEAGVYDCLGLFFLHAKYHGVIQSEFSFCSYYVLFVVIFSSESRFSTPGVRSLGLPLGL